MKIGKNMFRNISLAILIFFILTHILSSAEELQPLELAKKIFTDDSFSDIDKYSMGEYAGRPKSSDLSDNLQITFRLLNKNDKTAVVNMTLIDPAGEALDTYLHFQKDGIWKLYAFRTLAMTGIIAQARETLENLTEAQIDSIVTASKLNPDGLSLFDSREEYEFQLGTTSLTVSSDKKIISHFRKHKDEFERIKNSVLKEIKAGGSEDIKEEELAKKYSDQYRKLFITSVSVGESDCKNCIDFLIGGVVDNTVGYLYVKDGKDLPEMSPSGYIMIQEIGNGWYLYKTT